MANNREISQFAGLVTVNDTTNDVSIGATVSVGSGITFNSGTGSAEFAGGGISLNADGSATFDSYVDSDLFNVSRSVIANKDNYASKLSTADTGKHFNAKDTGGTTVASINADGGAYFGSNVGINSTQPATALNIGGGGVLRLGNASNSRYTAIFNDANFSEWTADVDPLRLRAQHSSAYIRFDTNGSERMRIDQNGRTSVKGELAYGASNYPALTKILTEAGSTDMAFDVTFISPGNGIYYPYVIEITVSTVNNVSPLGATSYLINGYSLNGSLTLSSATELGSSGTQVTVTTSTSGMVASITLNTFTSSTSRSIAKVTAFGWGGVSSITLTS